MKELTDRQREVFDFLISYYREHDFPPSMRNIGNHFGFSYSAAFDYLVAFEKKGVITREKGKPRAIKFVKRHFSLRVTETCPESRFRAGDSLIVCRITRPVAGDGVVIKKEDALRIEAFRGQTPILGKVVGLCREV